MATVSKENIGQLHEKLTVKLEKTDYLPTFEKALKEYSKKANIPGFRKGMVPAGLIKKMYGPSLFTDEVLKSVDRELIGYLQNEKLDIFAQPLPLEVVSIRVRHTRDATTVSVFPKPNCAPLRRAGRGTDAPGSVMNQSAQINDGMDFFAALVDLKSAQGTKLRHISIVVESRAYRGSFRPIPISWL